MKWTSSHTRHCRTPLQLTALLPIVCLLHVLLLSAGASVEVQVQRPACDLSSNGNCCWDLGALGGHGFWGVCAGIYFWEWGCCGKGGFGHEGPGVRALEVLSMELGFLCICTL